MPHVVEQLAELTAYRDRDVADATLVAVLRGLGSTVARLKLKGIDGDPHKRWMMWFNSMQREKPYLPLTCMEFARDGLVLEREP